MIPKQAPAPERLSYIILSAVMQHEGMMGVGILALVLKGSKDKRVFARELYSSQFFGSLFYYPVDVLENFIKQLVAMSFIVQKDVGVGVYATPVLIITDAGKKAVENTVEIALQRIQTIKPVVLNDTSRETIRLFGELKDISAVARERKLAESTVWSHLTTGVGFGILQAGDVVDAGTMHLILEKYKQGVRGFKKLKESLPKSVSYGEIQCVLASCE